MFLIEFFTTTWLPTRSGNIKSSMLKFLDVLADKKQHEKVDNLHDIEFTGFVGANGLFQSI